MTYDCGKSPVQSDKPVWSSIIKVLHPDLKNILPTCLPVCPVFFQLFKEIILRT